MCLFVVTRAVCAGTREMSDDVMKKAAQGVTKNNSQDSSSTNCMLYTCVTSNRVQGGAASAHACLRLKLPTNEQSPASRRGESSGEDETASEVATVKATGMRCGRRRASPGAAAAPPRHRRAALMLAEAWTPEGLSRPGSYLIHVNVLPSRAGPVY